MHGKRNHVFFLVVKEILNYFTKMCVVLLGRYLTLIVIVLKRKTNMPTGRAAETWIKVPPPLHIPQDHSILNNI